MQRYSGEEIREEENEGQDNPTASSGYQANKGGQNDMSGMDSGDRYDDGKRESS